MHVASEQTAPATPPPASCPVDHMALAAQHAPRGQVNPVNNIPDLAQAPSPGQKTFLPLERTISSIPRAGGGSPSACPVAHTASGSSAAAPSPDAQAKAPATKEEEQWEYPSPQQFYNALVRKGWETPEESIEMMVNIHNWLNEEAWTQVRRWEEKHDG